MLKVALSIIFFCFITGLHDGWRRAQAQNDYATCRRAVCNALYQNHFKQAADWADLALRLRRDAHPVNCDPTIVQDEWFAAELITLGKYESAEKLIQSLPPESEFHSTEITSWQAFRKDILVRADIGLHRYKKAALEANLPGCCPAPVYLLSTSEAFLLLGDTASAKRMFVADKAYPELYKLYGEITELTEKDDTKAQEIAKRLTANWWREAPFYYIYQLEFCEQMMRQKKCFVTANLLAKAVERTKRL